VQRVRATLERASGLLRYSGVFPSARKFRQDQIRGLAAVGPVYPAPRRTQPLQKRVAAHTYRAVSQENGRGPKTAMGFWGSMTHS